MDDASLTINQEELKALSSETRTSILKLLNERKYTLAELSKLKNVSPPSMKQQLKVLEDNNLIQQLDEGRKWKYYELTKKGKKLLNTRKKPIHITLILSASIFLLLITGIVFYANTIIYTGTPTQAMNMTLETSVGAQEPIMKTTQPIETKGNYAIDETTGEKSTTKGNILTNPKTCDLTYLNLNFIIAVILSLIIGYYLRQKLKEE